MIQTDDQALGTLTHGTMPNVIALAKRGTTFTEAIAPTSHGVRTTDEMLVVHTRAPRRGETRCRPEPQIEQYALTRDPGQLDNLAERSGDRFRERRDALLERARRLQTCAGTSSEADDPCE